LPDLSIENTAIKAQDTVLKLPETVEEMNR